VSKSQQDDSKIDVVVSGISPVPNEHEIEYVPTRVILSWSSLKSEGVKIHVPAAHDASSRILT